jgi:diguanylate cyclase (GGDEF)-like protein
MRKFSRKLSAHPNIFDLPRRPALLLSFCMLLAAAALDYITSYDVSLAALYLFAILTVSWNRGIVWGMIFVVLSIGCQIGMGLAQGHPYSQVSYFYQSQANLFFEYCVAVFLTSQLRSLFERERQTARIDLLTGVKNRQGFHEVLESEISRHLRNGASFCLAYVDCDNFKSVNDRFGHGEGDRLLEAVGHVTAASVRRSDTVGRLGGDEFAILFPETNQAEALAIEAKLREALETITRPRPWWAVTFSIGIATFKSMPSSADAAMGYVDQLMYRAKRSGKSHTISAVFDDAAIVAEGAGVVALRRIPESKGSA